MNGSLLATAFVMGLAGGPHCLAMCGAACAGAGRLGGTSDTAGVAGFQLGRLAGYSMLGAVAAATLQGIGWLGTQTAALRPLWTMLHVAALLLGLVLLVQARQPLWLDGAARGVWQRVRAVARGRAAPATLGVLWALLPCGLLYSALLVAALAAHPLEGAAVMASFAAGSGLALTAGPWLLLRLAPGGTKGGAVARGAWGVRVAGAALALSSGAVLLHGTELARAVAAWCA